MSLIRGFGPYHSTLMWWYGKGKHAEFYGGLLGWKPGDYNCGSFPDTSLLAPISLPLPDSSGVFCSSESTLPNGDLFLAGGTQPFTEFGTKHAYTFSPSSLEWTKVDSMAAFRFYPSSTALSDGRQVVLSGSQDHFLNFVGGLVNTDAAPADSAVFRYGDGANGHAFSPIRTSSTALWPSPREGHTAVGSLPIQVFGGKDRLGKYLNDYWQLSLGDNTFGSDFDYAWHRTQVTGPPRARWDHTTVTTPSGNAWMIVFGGIAKSTEDTTLDVVMNDVWRLWWDNSVPGLKWSQVTVSSPSGSPGARCGHVSLLRASDRRLLVFGGRGSASGSPTDSTLWSLNFTSDYSSATWEQLSATGPGPRFHHAVGYDPGTLPDTAFVFGGEATGGTKLNDLWRLNVGSLTWDKITYLAGDAPSARSRHTATLLGAARQLYVFGGSTSDSTVYLAHLGVTQPGELRTWTTFRPHSPVLSGHVAFFESEAWARVGEIYNPAANVGSRWTALSGAYYRQNYYPQTFSWKSDTVFVAGPDSFSYKLSLTNPQWVKYPLANSGVRGGNAVIYAPGKIMKCGSRDFEAIGANPAVGTTVRIDLSVANPQWTASGNSMLARENHNLVILPNGKVLVVGGTAAGDTTTPQKRPQIWDPNVNGENGAWFGLDTLASQLRLRDYHSTALLLPDGRVLSGGGNGNSVTQKEVEIFCPPYLFKSDGTSATRPVASGCPERVRYGAQFSVCLSASDSISSVCLIRAPAVTHGFDENQRYVPLTFTPANFSTSRLTATAPADSSAAPPGDYMLFLVNKKGVPSVARWVRMGASWPTSDVTRPARITDLATDLVTCSSVSLYWTAVGDDGATGTASYADLRRSTSPIDSSNFTSATPVSSQPVPVCPGTLQFFNVTGLAHNTTYYFAIKFSDESGNVSLFGNTSSAQTLEDCGLGSRAVLARDGSTSARDARGGGGRRTGSLSGAAPTGGASDGSPLVIEAAQGTAGLDVLLRAVADASSEGDSQFATSGVLLQTQEGNGQWTTRG